MSYERESIRAYRPMYCIWVLVSHRLIRRIPPWVEVCHDTSRNKPLNPFASRAHLGLEGVLHFKVIQSSTRKRLVHHVFTQPLRVRD